MAQEINVFLEGRWILTTKKELFEMASQGKIVPQTPIRLNGRESTAQKAQGIVFAAPSSATKPVAVPSETTKVTVPPGFTPAKPTGFTPPTSPIPVQTAEIPPMPGIVVPPMPNNAPPPFSGGIQTNVPIPGVSMLNSNTAGPSPEDTSEAITIMRNGQAIGTCNMRQLSAALSSSQSLPNDSVMIPLSLLAGFMAGTVTESMAHGEPDAETSSLSQQRRSGVTFFSPSPGYHTNWWLHSQAHQASYAADPAHSVAIDTNHDGKFDTVGFDSNHDGKIDMVGADTNHDGIYDVAMADTNGDGIADVAAADLDGDGIIDSGLVDTNFDGIADVGIVDLNGDGIMEAVDLANINVEGAAEAGEGLLDFLGNLFG